MFEWTVVPLLISARGYSEAQAKKIAEIAWKNRTIEQEAIWAAAAQEIVGT